LLPRAHDFRTPPHHHLVRRVRHPPRCGESAWSTAGTGPPRSPRSPRTSTSRCLDIHWICGSYATRRPTHHVHISPPGPARVPGRTLLADQVIRRRARMNVQIPEPRHRPRPGPPTRTPTGTLIRTAIAPGPRTPPAAVATNLSRRTPDR